MFGIGSWLLSDLSRVPLLSAAVFCFVGCGGAEEKPPPPSNIPVIDLRGPEPHPGGELSEVVRSPFPENAFESPCEPAVISADTVVLKARITAFSAQDPTSHRQASSEDMEFEGLTLQDGRFRIPGIIPDSTYVGGEARGLLSLSEPFSSFAQAEARAMDEILAKGRVDKIAEQSPAEAGLVACIGQASSRQSDPSGDLASAMIYDARNLEIRQNAALTAAAILGHAFLNFSEYPSRPDYASLFQGAGGLAPIGFYGLREFFVDYEFVAPHPETGELVRFLRRFSRADNLVYSAAFRQEVGEAGAGPVLNSARHIEVWPHSRHYVDRLQRSGGRFWSNPTLLFHEFGHHLFNETVARPLHTNGGRTVPIGLLPRILFRARSISDWGVTRNMIDVQDFSAGAHVVKAARLTENSRNSGELTQVERLELIRRIDFTHLALNEALADMTAAALKGDYSGFKAVCVGPDRDPRVARFGEGRGGETHPKSLPQGLALWDATQGDPSWIIQGDSHHPQNHLVQSTDCARGGTVSLASPYTLGSMVTQWLEESLVRHTGMSFIAIPSDLRKEFVLDAYQALAKVWRPWVDVQFGGFASGRFHDFGSEYGSDLLQIAKSVSLAPSVQVLAHALFDETQPGSWLGRHGLSLRGTFSGSEADLSERRQDGPCGQEFAANLLAREKGLLPPKECP